MELPKQKHAYRERHLREICLSKVLFQNQLSILKSCQGRHLYQARHGHKTTWCKSTRESEIFFCIVSCQLKLLEIQKFHLVLSKLSIKIPTDKHFCHFPFDLVFYRNITQGDHTGLMWFSIHSSRLCSGAIRHRNI